MNLRGRLVEIARPQIMGIVNATPDSFFSGSRTSTAAEVSRRVERHIAEGADMIDVGACSSRSGAAEVSVEEELSRLRMALRAVREVDTRIPVSVDTFRASVAEVCIEELGADIVNDISGGLLDDRMFDTVARLRVPYILMHMRGTPATMQTLTDYADGVTAGVISELSGLVRRLEEMGVTDIIVDPGFGFSKTLEQNYELAANMGAIAEAFGKPLLVGISRKSMLTRLLGIDASEALEATTALNMALIERGASIVRVHDVRAARQALEVAMQLSRFSNTQQPSA